MAWFIIVACAATLYAKGHPDIKDGADAAQALRPLAGQYAYLLFAAGLFNASLFAASILPISTSYAVCEGLGFESGVDKKFHEAPVFYWLYTALIVAGAGVLLIPRFPLVHIMVLSQVVNGAVLPFVLIFMLLLINDRELMGEYVNSRQFNIIAWVTVVVMVVLTLAMVITQLGVLSSEIWVLGSGYWVLKLMHSRLITHDCSFSAALELIVVVREQDVETGQRSVAPADVGLQLHLDIVRQIGCVDVLLQRPEPIPQHDHLVKERLDRPALFLQARGAGPQDQRAAAPLCRRARPTRCRSPRG